MSLLIHSQIEQQKITFLITSGVMYICVYNFESTWPVLPLRPVDTHISEVF
jgi:hypothetical protein